MNLSSGRGSMPIISSSAVWKPADAVTDQFPDGLCVVDDDLTCLMILEKILRTCLYEDSSIDNCFKVVSTLLNVFSPSLIAISNDCSLIDDRAAK
ncbi:hypothetical protein V6N11_060392 [Hibiscus sabdariffa]|uniref:Uncharacterized protein n=1 Tax=Hibiscus sabdariffa TaxID=183260 RepID=A0ABR2QQJ3_9ROSI